METLSENTEDLKYFKLNDKRETVIIIQPKDELRIRKVVEEKGLEMVQIPADNNLLKNAQIISAADYENERFLNRVAPMMMHNYDVILPRVQEVIFEGPCCARCKLRFGANQEWCSKHYRSNNCYRFKLDK